MFPQGDPRGIPQGDVPGEPPSPQGSLLGNPSGRPLGEVTQGDHLWDPPRGFTGGPSWLLAVPRCGDFKESAAEMSGILKVTILGSPTAQVEAVQAEDPLEISTFGLKNKARGNSRLINSSFVQQIPHVTLTISLQSTCFHCFPKCAHNIY